MDEKSKAEIYLKYLDRILAGEKVVAPVEDLEINELLLLARTMIDADLSVSTKTREKFRRQILEQIYKSNKSSWKVLSTNDDELNDEDLELVAAGFAEQDEEHRDMIKRIKQSEDLKNRS